MNSRCILCSTVLVLVVLIFSVTVRAQVEYTDIEWTELIPADDLEVLLNPPDFLFDIEDQSENDNMEALKDVSLTDATIKRYQEALESTRVVESFDGENIRLPGFVVPLSIDTTDSLLGKSAYSIRLNKAYLYEN